MKYLDFIIAIPLIWGAILGFKKGLIIELSSIIALILGIAGAIHFSAFTAEKLRIHFDVSTEWLGFAAFLITFLAIVLSIFLLARMLDKAIKALALGLPNRIAGMLFGILKYALLMSFLFYFFNQVNGQFHFVPQDWHGSSFLYKPVVSISELFDATLEKINIDEQIDLIKDSSDAR